MSPSTDDFITCSLDNTVRLWDIRSPNMRGQLNITTPTFAVFDPSASVLAIASPATHAILLYDAKNFEKPPFASFDLLDAEQRFNSGGRGRNWSKIEFSNDGKSLLIATTGPGHFILDAFDGNLKHFCTRKSGRSERKAPGEPSSSRPVGQGDACFSPDGRFLVGGSGGDDGLVAWDVSVDSSADQILQPVAEMPVPSQAAGRCEVVGYNPKHNMLVTADKEILLWLPDPELAG
jgi:COMPASS component SWD2